MKRTPVLLLFSLDFCVNFYEETINFQYIFLKFISVSRIFKYQVSRFSVSSFMISTKFGKKAIFFNVLTKLLLKTLWKSYLFYYKSPKFTSVSAILLSYRILKLLLLKWRSFQYNVKFEMKTSFIIVLTRLLSKRLW